MTLRCTRCDKKLSEDDTIRVINRFAWCNDCFENAILPQMTMSVKEYFQFNRHVDGGEVHVN